MRHIFYILLFFSSELLLSQIEEGLVVVHPREIDDILINLGIGFTTFQRFNGDTMDARQGWAEGFPIEYQEFDGNLDNKNHPQTSIAYLKVYLIFMEPEKQEYRWDILDQALETAAERNQRLMLRTAPDGTGEDKDVPDWYRLLVGSNEDWKYNNPVNKWMVDPKDFHYVQYFGGLISEMGKRYDGHPGLKEVDLSIVGVWGEGEGYELLSQKTNETLIDAFTDYFKNNTWIWGDKPHWAYEKLEFMTLEPKHDAIEWTPNIIDANVNIEGNIAHIKLISNTLNLKEYQMKEMPSGDRQKVENNLKIDLTDSTREFIFRIVNLANTIEPTHKVVIQKG